MIFNGKLNQGGKSSFFLDIQTMINRDLLTLHYYTKLLSLSLSFQRKLQCQVRNYGKIYKAHCAVYCIDENGKLKSKFRT